jgi:hypothetical protein
MLTVARTAVPAAVAGLLLTACGGGGKAAPAALTTAPIGANQIAPAPMDSTSIGGAPMGTGGMAGVGIDATAPMSGAAPMRATLPLPAAPLVASMDAHTITTRGVGKASATPDTLTVTIGVSTQDSSAKAALDANNAKASALIELLRKNGVADKDLRTRQLSINPSYDYKSGTISGYQVDNTVQATLHNIATAGALLDAAAGVVGNAVRVRQLWFSVGDDSALRAQSRAQAVNHAKDQAAQIAKAAGVTLGPIRSITELVDYSSPSNYDMQAASGSSSASVPLQPGQQELSVSVAIIYDMS